MVSAVERSEPMVRPFVAGTARSEIEGGRCSPSDDERGGARWPMELPPGAPAVTRAEAPVAERVQCRGIARIHDPLARFSWLRTLYGFELVAARRGYDRRCPRACQQKPGAEHRPKTRESNRHAPRTREPPRSGHPRERKRAAGTDGDTGVIRSVSKSRLMTHVGTVAGARAKHARDRRPGTTLV
jgi:hypothetical protein